MLNNDMILNAQNDCTSLMNTLENMSIADLGVMKDGFEKAVKEYNSFCTMKDFDDTTKKINIGLYALRMKTVCIDEENTAKIEERKPTNTWNATQNWLCETLNRGVATLYSYMYMAKFSDVLEFTEYGSSKLLKLTKALGHYVELKSMSDNAFDVNCFLSIKDISSKIKGNLSNDEMRTFHNEIISNHAMLIQDALCSAAKGKAFEEEIKNLQGEVPYCVAKELVEAMTREVPNTKKIAKILSVRKKKSTPSVFEAKISKRLEQLKKLFLKENTPENQLKLMKAIDAIKATVIRYVKETTTENSEAQDKAA